MSEKAGNLMRAIRVLAEQGLSEEGYALCRVLVELLINMVFLVRNSEHNNLLELLDAWLWNEIVAVENQDYYRGSDLYSEELELLIKNWKQYILSRYSMQELKRLQRHGFSRMPVSERAKQVGLTMIYDSVYRRASRGIHAMDLIDTLSFANPEQRTNLTRPRLVGMMGNAAFTFVQIQNVMSGLYDLGLEEKLAELRKEVAKTVSSLTGSSWPAQVKQIVMDVNRTHGF
jgi:hypothetical protein